MSSKNESFSSDFSYDHADILQTASKNKSLPKLVPIPASPAIVGDETFNKDNNTSGRRQSEYSNFSDFAVKKPEISEFRAFQPPPPPNAVNRESMISHFSDYSGRVNSVEDLGKPQEVRLVENKNLIQPQPHHQVPQPTVHQIRVPLSDVESDASYQVGKLPTTKAKTPESRRSQPDYTYTTNIEGAIPARSPRRPKSEVLSSEMKKALLQELKKKKHRKHQSVSITDDLDQLMKSASNLTVPGQEAGPGEFVAKRDLSDFAEPRNPDEFVEQKNPTDVIETRDPSGVVSKRVQSVESEPFEEVPLPYAKQRDGSNSSLPPRPSLDNILKARELSSATRARVELLQTEPVESAAIAGEELSTEVVQPAEPVALDEDVHIQQDTKPRDMTPTSEYTEVRPSEFAQAKLQTKPDDDEYYDIGEPVLVRNPTRVKSVKDSTTKPGHRRTRSRPKSSKSKRSSELKPFSYSTLINLLESMNGTIIGEEFSQLNLPVKEKQLIEKIVDALSRLTLDMVIDESRYEIGIQRLEKALRVLEGFM